MTRSPTTLPAAPVAVGSTARRTAANALVSAVAQVLGKVATLAWTLVATRQLTQQDFGAFSYILAIALLLSAIAEWGFDPVLVRRGSGRPERLPDLLSQTVACELAVGIPLFVVVGGLLA